MGLMDKVKAQAEQAVAKAQQGVAQGQAKLETYQQQKHSRDALLKDLGAAYFAWARNNGPQESINAALAAIDAADAADAAAAAAPPADPAAPPVAPPPPEVATPPGGFNLDDI